MAVQNGILLVSAFAAIGVIYANGKQERRRATIDAVIDQNRDEEVSNARRMVLNMHDSGETNLCKYLENPDSPQYKAILLSLNTHEFIAGGIREKAFDEKTYKRIRFSTVLKHWTCLSAFIIEFRRLKSRDTLYQDFEWLVSRWNKNPLKKNKP